MPRLSWLLFFLAALPCLAQPGGSWRTRESSDPALTGKQRGDLMIHNELFSPGVAMRTLLPTVLSHVRDSPPEWHRTADGFSRRLGVRFTMQTSRGLLNAAGAAALGRDPRYQRCGCTGVWRRTGHALSGIVLTADASGRRRFDPSPILSAYGSGYLASGLYPDQYRWSVKGYQLGSQQLGQVTLQNVFLEFGPEIKRVLRKLRR